MAIYDLWLSRNNGPTVSNYVGHAGRLFYDPAQRVLRISDGITAGGFPITPTTLVSTTEPTVAAEGQMWYNPDTFELWCYHAGNFEPTIDVATSTKLGGVKLGPGVTTNELGQIIIDPEGLSFSFGDFSSTVGTKSDNVTTYAVLSSIHPNEDIVIASNGTGDVSIVGQFSVHATNGELNDTLETEPAFRIKSDGQIRILVPDADATEGAVSIVGSSTGAFIAPINTGVMLHITGNYDALGIPSRVYNDSQNAFAAFVGRRFNGTVVTPTAVLADEELMRITATAHNGTAFPTAAGQRISYRALGNQTLTNGGGAIEFWTTPVNTTTIAKIATVDSTGIILESGKVLTGNVTIGAGKTLDVTGATVTGLTLGGFNPADVAGTMTGTTIKSTVTGSSLTSVGTLGSLNVTNTVTAGLFDGINKRTVRSVGTVADGGTVTINFATDDVVEFTWGNGVNLAYSNYTAGRLVKVIAKKVTGTGTDSISLGGLTAANVSSGTTSIAGNADNTYFIELICTNTTIGSVYAKV